MKWIDFVMELDAIRSRIRAECPLKEDIPEGHVILDTLLEMLTVASVPRHPAPPPMIIDPAVDDDGLAACAPEPQKGMWVDRGNGEGRVMVMPRETKHIVRKPVLEEVFDEKELGK